MRFDPLSGLPDGSFSHCERCRYTDVLFYLSHSSDLIVFRGWGNGEWTINN